jgi:Flp pilus assembly pilin Flp
MWVVLTSWALRLRADRRAATAIEYALIGSLVAGAAMAGMLALGVSLDLLFTTAADQIVAHTPVDPTRCVEVGSSCPK